jgi:hypothetical protein
MGGDYCHRHPGMLFLNVAYQLNAVSVRKAHVGKTELEVMFGEQSFGGGNVSRCPRLYAHAQQCQFKQFADIGFIIHDQSEIFVGCHS